MLHLTLSSNYEGFDFIVSGPYQEFPIKSSGVYSGGKTLSTRSLPTFPY